MPLWPLMKDNVAWVDRRIFSEMSKEAHRFCPRETGGVLMGYWAGIDQVVITNMIGPGPKAVHRRYFFTPDDQWHVDEIARIYEQSGRVITYLGDWHSHPYGSSGLSIKDFVTLFRVAAYKPARAPRPIMGILHNNPKWELAVRCFSFANIISAVPAEVMKVTWFDEKDERIV